MQVGTRPPRVLLTGRPGCGKTTVIRRAVERIGRPHCVGFYTQEVRGEGRRRIGFDVVTLAGDRTPLARAGAPGPRVGRYGVDVASFERLALPALKSAATRPDRVLVIDEIGKMELLSPLFAGLVSELTRADFPAPLLGTVLAGRHPAVEPLRGRGDVEVIPVGLENRERLPAQLTQLYRDYLRLGAR